MKHSTPEELADKLYYYRATVGRVVDGDTAGKLEFDLGFGLNKKQKKARLFNIDTPEITHAKTPYEKSQGHEAARVTTTWFNMNPELIIHTDVPEDVEDDFGRALVTVYSATTGECLNQKLVDMDLAVISPDGQTKWRETHPG